MARNGTPVANKVKSHYLIRVVWANGTKKEFEKDTLWDINQVRSWVVRSHQDSLHVYVMCTYPKVIGYMP